jgi:hypothetical protein
VLYRANKRKYLAHALAVLTNEQKVGWKEMMGAPFEFFEPEELRPKSWDRFEALIKEFRASQRACDRASAKDYAAFLRL